VAIRNRPDLGKRVLDADGGLIGYVENIVPVPEGPTEADDQKVILDALNGVHAKVAEEVRDLLDETGKLAAQAAEIRRDIGVTSIRDREAIETRLVELRQQIDENLAMIGKGMASLGAPEFIDFRRVVANQIADIELTFADQDELE
jgi:hypothetical protein